MGEREVINVLKLANSNEIQLLQERVDYLRNQLRILEIEMKNKEYNLSTLDIRTKASNQQSHTFGGQKYQVGIFEYEPNEKR